MTRSFQKKLFLCLNYGSSNLKYALFRGFEEIEEGKRLLEGEGSLREALMSLKDRRPHVILHRVVHGMDLRSPLKVDKESLPLLEKLSKMDPLHNALALKGIDLCLELFPESFQYAVFDTDFHKSMPEYARAYGLDYKLYLQGIKRYGFHGLSYSYLLRRSKELLREEKPNLIMLHLGAGCSACVVKKGISVDTSMGYSPVEGLLMQTRPGDIDAGVLLELLRSGATYEELERILYRASGFRALGGVSDFQELLKKRHEDGRAELAYEVFLYRLLKYVGFYWFVLEGQLDALVFSGGIGENSPQLRKDLCNRLTFLGLRLDPRANEENREVISSDESTFKVFVIKTKEELEMLHIYAEATTSE